MTKKLADQIQNLPDTPGVYYFRGVPKRGLGGKILYVGKATSLRSRVRSYFREDLAETRSPWIAQMIARTDKIDFQTTDSVLEALILESAEIKKHLPPYNTREKDDKSYLYVIITKKDFPRILTVRGKELHEHENYDVFTLKGSDAARNFRVRYAYGPFPYGGELREALRIIRKIFPFRTNCKIPPAGKPGKLCFDAQIGLCPGVCGGEVTKSEYGKTIRHLNLFFQGKKGELIRQLTREMKTYAKAQEFEKAEEKKRQIFSLQHIQDVALIKKTHPAVGGLASDKFKIESYDIAHLAGEQTVGAMAVMEDGELNKAAYRRFLLRGASAHKADDTGNLREVLERRLNHLEWPLPNLIIVDGGEAQRHAAQNVLAKLDLAIPVVSVVKDERHRARQILGASELVTKHHDEIIRLNQDTHRYAISYHRLRRRKDSQF